MADAPRYRLDDLRRLAAALLGASGLPPARATALAGHLLWFDAAGAPAFGIACLPQWLERLDRRAFDPASEGQITHEQAGTAVLEARDGLPPLILDRAATVAGQKAREIGSGLVRVRGLDAPGPAAPVVAELAVGPFLGAVLGPGDARALALPAPDGPPLVADSALAGSGAPPGDLADLASPWALLAPDGDVLVAAVAVAALEPLATLHERVARWAAGRDEGPGLFLPAATEARRRAHRERGVPLDAHHAAPLRDRARQLHLGFPEPIAPPPPG